MDADTFQLPESVKVGAFAYEIIAWDAKEAADTKHYGEASQRQQRIRIDISFGRRRAASTLLHEILHCIWMAWSMHEGDPEERVMDTLESGLAAVYCDNPEVMRWIAESLGAG